MVNFITAVAYHFFPGLPAAFTQPAARLLARPCINRDCGVGTQNHIELNQINTSATVVRRRSASSRVRRCGTSTRASWPPSSCARPDTPPRTSTSTSSVSLGLGQGWSNIWESRLNESGNRLDSCIPLMIGYSNSNWKWRSSEMV